MNTKTVEFFVQKVITTVTFLSFLCFSLETDTISSSIILRDSETIVSRRQIFELGFFSPGAAALRYLGVFYSFSPETVVWVANRDNPLNDSYGAATISTDGNFVIMNRRNQTIWSTNASPSSINTTLQILDTGNLVLLDDLTGNTIWESFSNPSDVLLPTMRLSHNIKTGKKLMLSAWDNGSNPQEGSFTLGIEALNIPQILIWKIGRPHWRSGPWNGKMFLGVEGDNPAILNGLTGTDSAGDSYYTVPQRSSFSKLRLNSSGSLVETLWDDQKKSWEVLYTAPKTQCDIYGICGPFGSCSVQDSPICSCLRGFEPVNAEGWYRGNWSSGCRRRSQLRCNDKGDGFLKLRSMKVPDFGEQLSYRNVSECMSTCLGNCSCIAFAHEPNIGCMLWRDTLVDVQKFSDVGVDLYIRLPVTELGSHKGLSDMQKYVIIGVSLGVAGLVASSIIVYYVKRRLGDKDGENNDNVEKVLINHGSLATKRYSYNEIKKITKSFREKLGQGGYGIVYKGNLPDGQFVAVKVLIETSDNAEDFINEVASISRTSHVNIVNLLGFCHERKKRALVYEFMPNKSLDKFIYKRGSDDAGRSLEWKKLYEIAVGIARGLEYLHRGCNTRIVHFDIKPQNILLDEDFCPKISDFGLAKLVKKKQSIISMLGARGTIGYIAPEVFSRNFGAVSHKSDVYSYGMMLLEMGEARRFAQTEATQSSENYFPDKIYEHMLLDSGDVLIEERDEMKRKMLLIGLWCIQTAPSDRPSMTKVIEMLEGSLPSIHIPPKPFLYSPNLSEQQFSSSFSVNVETEHHTQG